MEMGKGEGCRKNVLVSGVGFFLLEGPRLKAWRALPSVPWPPEGRLGCVPRVFFLIKIFNRDIDAEVRSVSLFLRCIVTVEDEERQSARRLKSGG